MNKYFQTFKDAAKDMPGVVMSRPHFVTIDHEGELSMEWCFGDQGAKDSWRVSLMMPTNDMSAWTLLTCREFSVCWAVGDRGGLVGWEFDPIKALNKLLIWEFENEGAPSLEWASSIAD